MRNTPWVEVQRELINGNIIFDANCSTISYARIGGYSSRPYSLTLLLQEKIRTSEIKGVWRWWARVLLATALYKRGYNVTDLKVLDEYISEVIGSEESTSKLALKISYPEEIKVVNVDKLQNIPRVKLILRLREEEKKQHRPEVKKIEKLIDINNNFQLVVTKSQSSIDNREIHFALYSLVLALLLSGIGALLNRGFGKIKMDLKTCINDELKRYLSKLYSSGNVKDVKNNLDIFIKNSIKSAEEYLQFLEEIKKIDYTKFLRGDKKPIIPVLMDNYFKLEVLGALTDKQEEILRCIGNSTLKLEWKSYKLYGSAIENIQKEKQKQVYKEHGVLYHTWILGMPRLTKDPSTRRTTGYIGINRRISSIAFSLLRSNLNVYYVIIYGFLTYDWLEGKNLEYKGGEEENVFRILENKGALNPVKSSKIKPANIEDVFKIAFETSKTILEKCLTSR
jgi:CRISPR-associated protein Cmr1